MSSPVATLYRDLTCATASVVITLVVAAGFVQSTAVPPGARAGSESFVALHARDGWFGQPQPAVLVD
jgi:hypothetical protein